MATTATYSERKLYQGLHPDSFDFLDLIRVVLDRKLLVLITTALCLLLANMIVSQIPPHYKAYSLVIVEPQTNKLQNVYSILGLPQRSNSRLISEIEVIKSNQIAYRVIDKLKLYNDPEFNKYLPDNRIDDFQEFLITEKDNKLLASILKQYRDNLAVGIVGASMVVKIEYTSTDNSKAMRIANTVADTYIEYTLENKFNEVQRAADWLEQRIGDAQIQIEDAETKLLEIKQQENPIDEDKIRLDNAELADLNRELNRARVEYAGIYARLSEVKSYRSKGVTADILESRLIQNLKLLATQIEEEIVVLEERYGTKHPLVVSANNRLIEIKSKIRTEIELVTEALETELKISEEKIAQIREEIKKIESRRTTQSAVEKTAEFAKLQREFETNQNLYEDFLKDFRLAEQQEGIVSQDANVISYATIPLLPSYPNIMLVNGLSGLMGLFLGLGLALLLEKLDNSFKSPDQVEAFTGFPVFGAVPMVKKIKSGEIGSYILSQKAMHTAESVRSIYTHIKVREKNQTPAKIVTMTSSMQGEGKSMLSTWLGKLAAKSGDKVIVVDCDMRRACLHKTFSKSNSQSLSDYLSGNAGLEDVIIRDDPSGVHLITARDIPGQAMDFISSKKMAALIQSLGKAYDLVILDGPASLAVSDALLLSKHSDLLLYCIAHKRTERDLVAAGIKKFYDAGHTNIAIAMTKVNPRDFNFVSHNAKYYAEAA